MKSKSSYHWCVWDFIWYNETLKVSVNKCTSDFYTKSQCSSTVTNSKTLPSYTIHLNIQTCLLWSSAWNEWCLWSCNMFFYIKTRYREVWQNMQSEILYIYQDVFVPTSKPYFYQLLMFVNEGRIPFISLRFYCLCVHFLQWKIGQQQIQ